MSQQKKDPGEKQQRKSARPRRNDPWAPRRRARRRALQAIYQWQIGGHERVELINQFLEEQDWDKADAGYFASLVGEVIRENEALTSSLQQWLDRPMVQVDPTERAILWLASSELRFHPDIPVRVVIDEAVALAKEYGAEQSHGFINGVVDKAARHWRAVEFEPGFRAASGGEEDTGADGDGQG